MNRKEFNSKFTLYFYNHACVLEHQMKDEIVRRVGHKKVPPIRALDDNLSEPEAAENIVEFALDVFNNLSVAKMAH